eukprot:gene3031-3311_t
MAHVSSLKSSVAPECIGDVYNPVQLVRLSTDVADDGSCWKDQLMHAVARGILNPSTPVSAAAVAKLQQKASPCSYPVSNNVPASVPLALSRAEVVAAAGGTSRQMLKSLPTELLYDTVGLQLFEQVTSIPEYYLTAAEADILATHGPDIVKSCGITDGSMLLELGAGSMRKTRLLLEAVVAAGLQGISFCALDLCPKSLAGALQSLQGVFKGRIGLVGLVGTYEQGLEYIQQQQGGAGLCDSPNANSLLLHDLSMADLRITEGSNDLDNQADDLCCCNNGDCIQPPSAPAAEATETHHLLAPAGPGMGDSNDEQWCNNAAGKPAASGMRGLGQHKVILWLGSSMGNFTREGCAEFLNRIKELALQPGDKLLVGIDRRNPAPQVQLAYCDPQGVNRAFILNGLQHAKRILDEQLLLDGAENPSDDTLLASVAAHGSCVGGCCSGRSFSIAPEHFEHFPVYNEELGRNEVYVKALQDTVINVPAWAAACVTAANGEPDKFQANRLTQSDSRTDKKSLGGVGGDSCVVPVPIAAGELLHVAYSHKYSNDEVIALADAAGLQWAQAWTDNKQQYNLHMFSLKP